MDDDSALKRVLAFDANHNMKWLDLSTLVRRSQRASGLATFVKGAGRSSFNAGVVPTDLPLDPESSVFASFAETDFDVLRRDRDAQGSATFGWSIASDAIGDAALDLSVNDSSTTSSGISYALASRSAQFLDQASFLAPYDSLYGKVSGATISFAPAENATFAIGGFVPSDEDEDAQASMQKAELSYKTSADIELRFSYGWMQETGAVMKSQPSGVFGREMVASSNVASASILTPLTDKLSLFGAYTYCRSNATTSSELISDWSTIHSNAFGVGLISDNLVTDGDHFNLMIGQPLRASKGEATLKMPTATNADGQIVTETEDVDLSPEGRELVLESVYRLQVARQSGELATGAFLRFEPNHDPEAKPEFGLGVRFQKQF